MAVYLITICSLITAPAVVMLTEGVQWELVGATVCFGISLALVPLMIKGHGDE